MSASAYGIVLGIAALCGAIAIYLQRRWPDRIYATGLVCVCWSILVVVAFRVITGRPAPYFWTDEGQGAEPWERLAFPLAVAGLLWPVVRAAARRSPALELWLAFWVTTVPMVAALPAGESYLDVMPGNATWSLAALLAAGANWLASARFVSTGAERWSLWVFVAQLLTVAALFMTCYATLSEWCLLLGLGLAVLATCRAFVSSGQWTGTLSLPAIALSCSLLTHIRIYSGDALPAWVLSVPMFSPVLVCGVDRLLGEKRHSRVRIAIAATAAAVLAAGVMAYAMAPGGEEW